MAQKLHHVWCWQMVENQNIGGNTQDLLKYWENVELDGIVIQFHNISEGPKDMMNVMGGERDVENLIVVRRSNTW